MPGLPELAQLAGQRPLPSPLQAVFEQLLPVLPGPQAGHRLGEELVPEQPLRPSQALQAQLQARLPVQRRVFLQAQRRVSSQVPACQLEAPQASSPSLAPAP